LDCAPAQWDRKAWNR